MGVLSPPEKRIREVGAMQNPKGKGAVRVRKLRSKWVKWAECRDIIKE